MALRKKQEEQTQAHRTATLGSKPDYVTDVAMGDAQQNPCRSEEAQSLKEESEEENSEESSTEDVNEQEDEGVEEQTHGRPPPLSSPSSNDSSYDGLCANVSSLLSDIGKRIAKRDAKIARYASRRNSYKLVNSLKKRHTLLGKADEIAQELAKSRQDKLFGNTVYSLRFPELVVMIKEEASVWYESKVLGKLLELADLDVRTHSEIQDARKAVIGYFHEECKTINSMSLRRPRAQTMEERLTELAGFQKKRHAMIEKLMYLQERKDEELLERRMKCAKAVREAFLKQSPQVVKGRFGLKDVGMSIITQLDKKIQIWRERLEELTRSEKDDSQSSATSAD